ncbi:hypothetical protein J2S55_008972 [Streptosporangium brasiliense]|uniref:Uncharacterized protein n=1 Tax=Streptosporangium brasiliense TaxID=47480 RepID=A0ABT9RLK5_9ACTN|nr:hypothetical protein [Streptosporangium brasiliense]
MINASGVLPAGSGEAIPTAVALVAVHLGISCRDHPFEPVKAMPAMS